VFYGTGTSSVAVTAKGITDAAAKRGATVTFFDSKFDPATQLNQMQDALQSKKYNTWIVIPFDSRLDCKTVSQDAPNAGIVVVTLLLPVCGRDVKPVDQIWTPGTLAQIDGENTPTYKVAWLKDVAAREPGKHQVLSLTGPPLTGNALGFKIAVSEIERLRPDLTFVTPAATNFTANDAFNKTQNLLQANPNADVLVSTFSDMTQGAVQAIKAAGREGKIHVYDIGANKFIIQAIMAGSVTGTIPVEAYFSGYDSVTALADAFDGKPVKRFYDTFTKGTTQNPYFIDKSNAATYHPEY
jgi:ribose transport system substrate-binding protein